MTKLPNQPSKSTAYRLLGQFRDGGFIRKKRKIWTLTDLGKHHTKSKMNYLMVLPRIRPNQAT